MLLVKCAIGEVNDENVARNAQNTGDDTFNDEDPSPSLYSGTSVLQHKSADPLNVAFDVTHELLQSVCENTSQARCNGAHEIEYGISFLGVIARIPRRYQIDAARKESCFEHTKNQAKHDQDSPPLYKAKPNLPRSIDKFHLCFLDLPLQPPMQSRGLIRIALGRSNAS